MHFSLTSQIAPHSRNEFVAYPKTVRNRSLHENGQKEKSLCGKSVGQAGPQKFQAENFDEAEKPDLALCFFG